jgi:nucleotide-binding universal stress UspA family protein
MTNLTHPTTSPTASRTTGMRVVCGIDASRADETAVQAACEMAGGGGHVALVCVVHSAGVGATAEATIAPARASRALKRAMKQTRDAGVASSVYMLRSTHKSETLLRAAEDGDILVVGTHGESRAAGIALGGVTATALHRATVPVLVARPGHAIGDGPVLIASDGSPASDGACTLGGGIAARSGAPVILFTVDDGHGDEQTRHDLARQAVDLRAATGHEPTVAHGSGRPADAIVEAADGASIVVVGSHGRTGLSALGSVSERVAHRAPCSVLVVRPPAA